MKIGLSGTHIDKTGTFQIDRINLGQFETIIDTNGIIQN